jgi:HAD superfamily hydrolase (TIGR01509 family)
LNVGVLHWKPSPVTQALIFDCDGTLADTMPVHHRAWEAMLAEFGMGFSESEFYALAGMPSAAIIVRLAAEQGVELRAGELERMALDKELRYAAMIDEVIAIPELYAIADCYRRKFPMGVASGGERWVVTRTLQTIGVFDWMSAIVGAEDTDNHKPEPDVFLEAARRLGADPVRCTVFEDSDLGLEAGRRAGMEAVDIRPWR